MGINYSMLGDYTKGVCLILNPFDKYLNEENIINSITSIMSDMMSTITKMPKVSSLPGIKNLHTVMSYISFSCVGCITCYKGIKMLFSTSEIDNKEGRTLLERTTYSLVFSTLSLKTIDIMIDFGNVLIDVLMKTNNLSSEDNTLFPQVKGTGLIVALILMCLELLISIKILITFWMRMAELVFSGVISPVIFVLWINKEWSGFLKSWWRRVSILIFTQVAQVLLLVIYGKMINGLIMFGSFNSMCLSIAMLFLVESTPRVISGFMDSGSNLKAAESTFKNRKSTFNRTKNTISKFVKNKGE